MIDGIPATQIVQGMVAAGLVKFKGQKTPAEEAAYKEKRRKTIRECMRRLRDRRKQERDS
jgi:hypothetical protein